MSELNGRIYTAPNSQSGFTQRGLAIWALLVAVIVLGIGIATGDVDLVTIGNKLINVAIVLVAGVLFNTFYLSRENNTDANIFSNPLATAVYAGAVILACGIAVSL